jgi:hypothetical protein
MYYENSYFIVTLTIKNVQIVAQIKQNDPGKICFGPGKVLEESLNFLKLTVWEPCISVA